MTDLPSTPGQLADFLHERFGFGSYDEIASPSTPLWKERNTLIAKLKAMMRKRGVDERKVAIAALYAVRHRKPIRYLPQVFELIPEAMREHREHERAQRRQEVEGELRDAVADAIAADETEWAERLMRAPHSSAERLLAEWRESRG